MTDLALLAAAVMLALAGLPHCLAMCGACSAAVTAGGAAATRSAATIGLFGGRLVAYATAGALASAGLGGLRTLAALHPLLQPLWVLMHAAALGLGLWMLVAGRLPRGVERLGSAVAARRAAAWQPVALYSSGGLQLRAAAGAGGIGLAWVAWPCGLLQSALVLAALASGPAAGAAVMAAFAAVSAPALLFGPALLAWHRRRGHGGWPLRLAGLTIVATSGWALGHGLWQRVAQACGWA
jgi:uncharacterized protein